MITSQQRNPPISFTVPGTVPDRVTDAKQRFLDAGLDVKVVYLQSFRINFDHPLLKWRWNPTSDSLISYNDGSLVITNKRCGINWLIQKTKQVLEQSA